MAPADPTPSVPRDATLADLGEFGVIEALTAIFEQGDHVDVGPGDDAAVLWCDDDQVLVSSDLMVQDRHFRRDWSEAADVGHRAAAQNLSDINAMGGRAHSLTVGLAVPADLPVAWVLDFARGFAEECALVGASVVGGDLTRADAIVVAVTVIGRCRLDPVLRSGAEPGEVVAIAGRQGWAAGGLAVLSRGFRSPRALVEAHRRPQPPYDAGPAAADAGATAMLDVSDGLLGDLAHLARASGVSIDLERAALDVPEALQAVAAATGSDPTELVLTGGDDHSLVATFGSADEVPAAFRVIGRVLAADGDPRVTVDGVAHEGAGGWTHF